MPNDIYPLEIPEKFLTALGRVMVNWSQLEGILDFVLIKLLGASVHDVRYHVPISSMTFQTKMECLESLTTILKDNPGNEIAHARFKAAILPRLNGLQKLRNSITHCKWSVRGNVISRSRLTAKGKFKITEQRMRISELETMAEDILKTSGDLWAMVEFPEFKHALPAEWTEVK